MHKDDGRRSEFQCALDHFANIDGCMIYSAFALPFVFDQDVLAVEKKYMELLDLAVAILAVQ